MKNIIKIFISLLFFISCTNVYFENPQPAYLDNVKKIPSKFHGSFENIKYSSNFFGKESTTIDKYIISDKFCVINNDTLKVNSDDLIIKSHGNRLYVNMRKDSVYQFCVLNRHNYFGSDSIFVRNIFYNPDNRDFKSFFLHTYDYILTIIDSSELKESEGGIININDSLNVNELNAILNRSKSIGFKFNKK